MEKTYVPISFSRKQIVETSEHSDPNVLDKVTGKRAKIAKIIIVSPEKRKNITFGEDANGINRDERGAYIQIPEGFIKTDSKNEDRCYIYLSTSREYTIHFFSKQIGTDKETGKPLYDSPESIKGLSVKDIRGCFGLGDYKARKPKVQQNETKDLEPKQQQKKTEISK
jgi:hypothetical protein